VSRVSRGADKVDGDPPGGPPRQASLARLREFGVEPKRFLGQNFLVDDNILGVILDRLGACPDDVILEVGAGLGTLTRALAGVGAHVHTFEIDRSLEAPLRCTLGSLVQRVTIHLEDVLSADLATLRPPPTLCASNLPYSLAAPLLAESLGHLPGVRRYCVMVQREIAERIAAGPGSRTYGALSVWVQLHARVVEVRPLSRSIFHPRPRVDSSLLTLERDVRHPLVESEATWLKTVIDGAFAQRRKLLVNSLASSVGLPKEESVSALDRLGLSAGVRAEQLSPDSFVALAAELQGRGYPESVGRTGPNTDSDAGFEDV
jgi:16S rRNA (adenine1518-N6/adenine1519-N6)-dimethyltransferase